VCGTRDASACMCLTRSCVAFVASHRDRYPSCRQSRWGEDLGKMTQDWLLTSPGMPLDMQL
ncbi:hypothetical protein CSUI_008105, partial [Cystoisospora suis]